MPQYRETLQSDPANAVFHTLYGASAPEQNTRYLHLLDQFSARFGSLDHVRFFSASGRTEIIGNHTDHNGGRVLAAAVTFDTVAAVRPVPGSIVTLISDGYPTPFFVDLASLNPVPEEKNTTTSLIRGVAARMHALGCPLGGFQAAVTSNVQSGSGLSSSAAFEVLLCAVFDGLFGGNQVDPLERARIAQFAENQYFGKPCGLMDQTASSVGGLVGIDFSRPQAAVRSLSYDFFDKGYTLCVVNTGSQHDDLTADYAAITAEMRAVANALGQPRLADISYPVFVSKMPELIQNGVSFRALNRALHFYAENERVDAAVQALQQDDLSTFFQQINQSGLSSWTLLQNLYTGPVTGQSLCLALGETQRILAGRGACRIHGGGFAGTILAFVPNDLLTLYQTRMDSLFGQGACAPLGIRPLGACQVAADPDHFLKA